jgi:hypothetical protein
MLIPGEEVETHKIIGRGAFGQVRLRACATQTRAGEGACASELWGPRAKGFTGGGSSSEGRVRKGLRAGGRALRAACEGFYRRGVSSRHPPRLPTFAAEAHAFFALASLVPPPAPPLARFCRSRTLLAHVPAVRLRANGGAQKSLRYW